MSNIEHRGIIVSRNIWCFASPSPPSLPPPFHYIARECVNRLEHNRVTVEWWSGGVAGWRGGRVDGGNADSSPTSLFAAVPAIPEPLRGLEAGRVRHRRTHPIVRRSSLVFPQLSANFGLSCINPSPQHSSSSPSRRHLDIDIHTYIGLYRVQRQPVPAVAHSLSPNGNSRRKAILFVSEDMNGIRSLLDIYRFREKL